MEHPTRRSYRLEFRQINSAVKKHTEEANFLAATAIQKYGVGLPINEDLRKLMIEADKLRAAHSALFNIRSGK